MARKTVLFISAAHCHACTWQKGELSAAERFACNAEGMEQFAAFLQAHHNPILLLADLVEEDFRHESVPHLHGGERAALVRRKLEQYYRDTPFRQATTLQRRKEGRHDDMQFSALTNPALIAPWLDTLLAHNIPLAGIYSVPCVSPPLAQDIPSGHLLLLSWEKHAGLRQTYFDSGLLYFSRLTPLHDGDSFGATAATEAVRTQQYLKNLSLLPPGHPLDVRIICHVNDRPELEAQLHDAADMCYAFLDIQELGRHTGSRTVHPDSDATPLFLHLLATRPPHSHYATAEHTRFLRLQHVRSSLSGLSAALAASALLWAAANIMEYIALEDETMSLNAQAGLLSQQTEQIIRNFPETLASASDMKTAVLLSRKLGDVSTPPQTILEGVSRTLNDFPYLQIAKLSWQTNPEAAPGRLILLDGELVEFGGSYRGVLDYLERFRQTLIQHGYEVTAQSLPLDVSPQGSIADDAVDGRPAQFSLKISSGSAT